MTRHPELYDAEQDSTPLPQQYQMVEPGAVRRAFWTGAATAAAIIAAGALAVVLLPYHGG